MLKVYGSQMCPDCIQCEANYREYKVEYEFIDINESLGNLKELLRMRDSDPAFLEAKEAGSIGIPAIVREDGSVTLNWQSVLEEPGLPVKEYVPSGTACAIGRKGC